MRTIAGLVLAIAAFGCGPTPRAVDTKAEEQAIRDLDTQWNASFAKKDVDASVNFYAPDAWAMWPDGPTIKGTEAIRAAWTEFFKTPNLKGAFTPETIQVSSAGDMATDAGSLHLEMDTPKGHVVEDAKYLVVWRKVNGAWKAQYDTFNSTAPTAEAGK